MNAIQQRKLKEIANVLNKRLNDHELNLVMIGYNACINRLVEESDVRYNIHD